MARYLSHCIVACMVLVFGGCSRTSPQTTADAAAQSAEIGSDRLGQAGEQQPAERSDRVNEADRRAAQLAREIEGHRRRGYDAQAVAARREMLQLFTETYGQESWQVRSAQLALGREESLARFSPAQRAANEAAENRTRAANDLWAEGKRDEALTAIVQARTMATKIWGADTYGVANLLDQEARWRQAVGDVVEAEKLFRQALAIRERAFTPEHPETIATASALGRVLLAAGRPQEAAPLLRQSVAAAEKVWGESHAEYAGQLNNLALFYLETGDYQQAAEHFSRAADVWRQALGDDHPLVGEACLNLGRAWYAAGDYAQAEAPLREALASLEKNAGPAHAATRRARVALGLARMAQRDYQEAETILRADLAIVTGQFGDKHPETAESLVRLAILYGNQGRYAEALPLAERGAAQHRAAAGEKSDLTRNADSIVALVRGKLSPSGGNRPGGSTGPRPSVPEAVRTNFEQPARR
ncbi:MAG TPA: tetratricopeptide repeat protein [Pirellulales bacterium]|nr:tetratricopeptide repeat protein [Pirellulales bacterium]